MKRTWIAAVVLIVFTPFSTAFARDQFGTGAKAGEEIIPRLIQFSGALKDSFGLPQGGLVAIRFALYASQEGGESLWRETQLVELQEEGRYTVYLGASDKEGLPMELFSTGEARWLGIQVEGQEEELRVVLVAVPYALKAADADTVGGKPPSSFVLYEDLLESRETFNVSPVISQQFVTGDRERTSPIRVGTFRLTTGGATTPTFSTDLLPNDVAEAVETSDVTSFGYNAGTTGTNVTFVGAYAGYSNSTGVSNSFFGNRSGEQNTTGSSNAFIGISAGYSNTTGWDNSFIGPWAGYNNTEGNLNSFVGSLAGYSNTRGWANSFVGYWSGFNTTEGNSNSFVGVLAGNSNTTENNNSYIGAYSDGTPGITNATAIGYRAKVTQSNSLVLGGVKGQNGATEETNIGIGVTNPDRQLTVEGTQAIGRFRRFYGTGDPYTRTFAPAFLFERARPTQEEPTDIWPGDYLGKVQFHGRVGGNQIPYGAMAFIATDTNQNGRFSFIDRDIATERVSILNTGNVGIGTTTPAERLHVVGNIRVTGAILYGASEASWPDYVFNPNYKLMRIDELEEFIAKEKHLPNIPSSDEIKDKQMNLIEFQMKLLEKIEELTLYAIQQEGTIRIRDQEIAALKSSARKSEREVDELRSKNDVLEKHNNSLEARITAVEQMLRLMPK